MDQVKFGFVCLLAMSLPAITSSPVLASAEDDEFFEKKIRPLLAAKCLECHGADEPEAGLRLTSRALTLKGGQTGPAIIERDAEKSLLIKAVSYKGRLKMPPDNKLADEEIADLRRWIELGAPWPETAGGPAKPRGEMVVTEADRRHWAFRPVADPASPAVSNAAWIRTSVDSFILSKLESAGLAPAPPADRRTLIRRAYYDLVGLPPTWEEVQAFENDASPQAFERLIDRLLASPNYGERWGRHWLDVARYADTKDGVLMYGDDRVRPYAYTYRDYVIRAFNEDTPYNQLIQEQLAADQIVPKVDSWKLGALGFLTLGRMYDNNVHDVIDDQIDVVTRGFLGLTAACARCHDHKYDPIPQADYYSLYGVFASSEVPLELPVIESSEQMSPGAVEFEQQFTPKRDDVRKMLDDQYALLSETARARVVDYLTRVATTKPDPLETAIFFLSLAPEDLRPPIVARWRRLIDQRAVATDPIFRPWHDVMQLPEAGPQGTTPESASAAWVEGVTRASDKWRSLPDGVQEGQLNPLVRAALGQAVISSRADVARIYGELLKRVYDESKSVATGTASPPDDAAARRQLLDVIAGRESPTWFPKSQTRRFMSRQDTDAFGGKVQELDRMAVKSPHAPPRAMVMNDAPVLTDPCIFVRGNPSQRGRPVSRQFLAIASPGPQAPFPNGSGRLDLARAIAAPNNPLTPRVIVNRVWMHHFGEPLVATPSDFGLRSTPPAHPELLDHLATCFINEGWSFKSLHRRIMLSATWQQASTIAEPAAIRGRAADPDDRLLWRAHRRRLDLEAMRDTLLVVSNRLANRTGGRPVDIAGDPQARSRTIYGLVDRQNLPGFFRAFDFATPDQSVERRPRTMVPQQALFALNSPFVVEQAKSLASRHEIAGVVQPAEGVTALYHIVLTREPTPEELRETVEFVASVPAGQSQLGAWQQLAQVLLASNELMYVD